MTKAKPLPVFETELMAVLKLNHGCCCHKTEMKRSARGRKKQQHSIFFGQIGTELVLKEWFIEAWSCGEYQVLKVRLGRSGYLRFRIWDRFGFSTLTLPLKFDLHFLSKIIFRGCFLTLRWLPRKQLWLLTVEVIVQKE